MVYLDFYYVTTTGASHYWSQPLLEPATTGAEPLLEPLTGCWRSHHWSHWSH